MSAIKIHKKLVQDIVPSEKRSIRNIPIRTESPTRRKKEEEVIEEDEIEIEEVNEQPIIHIKKHNNKKKSGINKYLLSFLIVFTCIAIIGVALSLSYSKATVTITPKIMNFNIDGTFTAKSIAGIDDLNYEVINASNYSEQIVPATVGPLIETKAKATVNMYNNFSTASQTLVAGTRLTGPDGLTYRIASSVTIPGRKTVQGTVVPGSVSAVIVADQAGANYNSKVTDLKGDFKVLGYKGTSKYDAFYARLKTDLAGGFSGNKVVVAADAKKTAITTAQNSLNASLISKLKLSLPKEYILYDNAISVEYESGDPILQSDNPAKNTAVITVRGTAYGTIFKGDSLIKFIAGKEIKKFPSDTYTIKGDNELDFKIANLKDFSAKKANTMIFNLKGPITVTGTFSESKLKEELKGISVKSSNAVFAKYTSIANAYALITPFWLRSFPNSIDKIIIDYKP